VAYDKLTPAELRAEYCRGLEEINRLRVERDALRSQVEALTKERDHYSDALRWIAGQPCGHFAEGSSADTPCLETDACCTEWCLSCYAKATLAEAAQGETGCIQEALVCARAVLREVLDSRVCLATTDRLDRQDASCLVRNVLDNDIRAKAEQEVGR
jgi:hypothetical protein